MLAAGGMYVYLLPSLPADLKIPVAVYCTAIALMGVKAIGRPHKHFKSSGINMGVGGALLFVISDSVLSFALFKGGAHDRQAFKLVVMATYYGAQMLIALSACDFISGAKPAPKQD